MDGESGSQGNFRTLLDVSGVKGHNKGEMEMANLLNDPGELPSPGDPGDGPVEPTPGMKRVESSELLNLTLHQSARNGDVRSTRILLQTMGGNVKKKINAIDEDSLTPLHYAARYNHIEVVKTLMEFGADPNSCDYEHLTPLHYASRYHKQRGNKPEPTHDENTLGANGMPPSESTDELSVEQNVVDYLVKHGAKINAEDKYGLTPLHYAAMRGNDVAAGNLLSFKDILIEAGDKQGMSPLHMAATHNHVEVARMLIEVGAGLRSPDNEDLTPLHCAATEGNMEIVKLLFEAGAQKDGWVTINNMVTDRDCDSSTCLHVAVENGHYDVVKLCIAKRADVNTPCANYFNPIHLAAKAGDVRIVRLLVDNNARIDALNDEQQTPLHIAAAYNHCDVLEFLIDRGAQINRKEKDNFTPLLMAASYGHAESVDLLLKKGADYGAVDKKERTAIYMCAEEDNLEALKVLMSYPEVRNLIDENDRNGNYPLHIAAEKGYTAVVKCLLDNGADLDCKNEEEMTPIHLASKMGRTNTVRELVRRDKSTVNDEDENSDTALHLAALFGNTKVVDILLSNGADVAARNSKLWTPLDCAAAKGFLKSVRVLLDSDAPIDPMDKAKTTPLHLASSNGHANVVEFLIQKGANVTQRDSDGNNCLDLAIDNNKPEVANAIIQSDYWEDALRNDTLDIATGLRSTPMRKLIKKLPQNLFNRCMTSNGKNPEHPDYTVVFNYEFLDDVYSNWSERGASEIGSSSGSVYDEDFKLSKSAKPYTTDSSEMKKNHPLMIMVTSGREDLLAHPMVTSLLRHKWNSFGRVFYYINFLIYAIFLTFLTGYIVTTKAPYEYNTTGLASTYPGNNLCEQVNNSGQYSQYILGRIGKYVIMALAAWNLLRELLQIYQAKLQYLGFENLIEWVTYVCALLLVIDFDVCQRATGFRYSWQWSLGAVAIFLAWIDLVLFFQKFPRFGIYVVMFKDILNTFLQFFIVFFFFIVAFGLGFYTLLQNQPPFNTVWQALIKTSVMMIGEFEYDDLFNAGLYIPQMEITYILFVIFMILMSIIIMNLLAPFDSVWQALIKTSVMMIGEFEYDAIFNDPANTVNQQEITYIIFIVFMIIMSILIMNLLVGLAVDDIKLVQDQAALKRMAMQVDLALDVERVVPEIIRRRFVVKSETVRPNEGSRNPFKKLASIESGALSSASIAKALDPELDEIEKVQEAQEQLQKDVNKLRLHMKELRATTSKMESMMKAMLQSQNIEFDEEDFQDES